MNDAAAYEAIAKLYDLQTILAGFENYLSEFIKDIGNKNRTVSLTECHWWALITKMAATEAAMRASFHFNRVKRTELEQRISLLESKPHMKYVGVWNVHNQYNEGDITTHDGSAFYCKRSTCDKPGTSDCWQLMIKRGKDGKDAR